ncbi:putative late blight resistance protein -like protein R1B-14-like [Capsicum annuum]|nr:putative late blight resistance protein -like protein R1B-14-like [Capsicum annuum]
MPGSGKTTLAYKVYHDKSVARRFDTRAWCTVGQEYDKRKLLEKVYNQVTGSDSKLSENIDVADELRRHLIGKKYLVVLDDLWDTDTWHKLKRPFPLDENGSRIILTTREMEVALDGKRDTDPLKLRLLKSEESWELLEKRAFGVQSCPDELLDVGKEIAENCKGLPLVADLIAGVIAGREKTKSVWLEVRNNLNSFIFGSEVDVMKVIELSYDHLPHHLKPCFLYLARSLKDTALDRNRLKMFWCAEGLVEQTEMMSLDEVMEIFLDNLISSSLVISYNDIGDQPICQLHDLVHDFCLIKSKEEKLLEQISSSDPSFSSSHLMSRIVKIDYNKEHFELNNFVLFSSKMKRHSGKHLYSLEIAGDEMKDDACHLRDLRLLRVLILYPSFITVKDSLLNEIGMLNHLRYLHIGTEVKSLPPSFSNLLNLETLLVTNKVSTLVLLPRIWDLVKLGVLSVQYDCSFIDLDIDEPIVITEDSKLENLRELRTLVLSYSKETEDIFIRFPNLQRFIFVLKESCDYSTERYWFPKLDFLDKLDFLRVEFESSNTNYSGPSLPKNWSWDFHFPSNLRKLEFWDFPLASNSLSTIVRLPNLEELFLTRTIMQGEEWNMGEEDTFENLKYLYLEEVTLAKWEFEVESFPVLEKLELSVCHKLSEIPPNFGDIGSLKIIKLDESPQLEDSAQKIKEYVEYMMGGELEVRGYVDETGIEIFPPIPQSPDYLTLGQPDAGFGAIVHHCKGLRQLSLSGLHTDRVLYYMRAHAKRLEMLFVNLGLRRFLTLEIRDCAPLAATLLVNAAWLGIMWYFWMSSCSLSYGACLLLAQKLPRVTIIRTRDQKVSQLRNSSYTEQWQHGVRMETYLEALDLWEAVEDDYEIVPLSNNLTIAQIKSHREKKTTKSKAKATLFASVSTTIFRRIMYLTSPKEIWDYMKKEYGSDERIRGMQVLNLIREFELQRMKDAETVKVYSDRLLGIVKKVRLLGTELKDSRIVEKILVTVPER